MKILIITSYTIPDYAGGGRNAWQFASYLNRIGNPNKILTLNRNLKYRKKEIFNGVIIRRLPYFNANQISKLISYLFFVWPGYFFHVLMSDYIYIIGANIIGYQGFIWLASMFGKTIVFRSSLLGFDDINSLLGKSKSKFLYQHFTLSRIHVYLSINPSFNKSYEESGIHLKRVIEKSQGVDTDLFLPISHEQRKLLRKKYEISPGRFLVLSVGHIIKRKGFDHIIDHLSKLNLDFLYLVAGETNYENGHFMSAYSKETKVLIESGESTLAGKLRLSGPVDDIVELYQMADVFLLGSYNEGTPNVLLEAMSCGLPVICRDLEGISNFLIFPGKNGYLFSDYESFKFAFLNLYSDLDKCRELGRFSRTIIEKDHSFEKFYQTVFQK
jgi:glycosyltransferase involved in cell wall biosynthesis